MLNSCVEVILSILLEDQSANEIYFSFSRKQVGSVNTETDEQFPKVLRSVNNQKKFSQNYF